MNKNILTVPLAICLYACQPLVQEQTSDNPNEQPKLVTGIEITNMDPSVRPGDDFFRYTNGGWLANNPIPEDRSSYGTFDVLYDRAQEDIREIIRNVASDTGEVSSDRQKVRDLYTSFMDMETRNQLGFTPLRSVWSEIDAIENLSDLAVFFASANRRGYDMPFILDQYVDFEDPDFYMIYTWQSGLGLPDRSYYLNDDRKSAAIQDKYRSHIHTMLSLAGLSDAEGAADLVMALETRMAEAHIPKEETRDALKTYNRYTRDELLQLMPGFNWSAYLTEAGVEKLDWYVISMPDHMTALDTIITSTPIDDWKKFLKWKTLNSTSQYLNEEVDNQSFEFYGTVLLGQEEPRPLWRRGIDVVNDTFGEIVGKIYVRKHFPPEARERVKVLVRNLIIAYEASINDLDWMSDATRERALDKLAKFRPKIGYPDQWRDYSSIRVSAADLYGNIERAAISEYERKLARQDGPVDRSEWDMNPQTVNAYYSAPLNEIVFPAAILQPPFFNMKADDAVNYGGIGAVIGHEIGHGFDDEGSRFDGDGVLQNWWTDEDREQFELRTARLVEQYRAFEPFEDLTVNGEFTLGENIGDLGGISIGLLAYQMSLGEKEAPVIDGFTGVQRVFLGYAQIWRENIRDDALRQMIATNPHAPAEYRANGAVRNVPAFYEAFEVSETDRLYIAPEKRVKIW